MILAINHLTVLNFLALLLIEPFSGIHSHVFGPLNFQPRRPARLSLAPMAIIKQNTSNLEGVPKSLKGCRKPYRIFGMGVPHSLGNLAWGCQNYGVPNYL